MRRCWNLGDPVSPREAGALGEAIVERTGGQFVPFEVAVRHRPLFVDFVINQTRGFGIEGTCSPG